MQTIKLGRSGLDVSSLCLGTMLFGNATPENTAHELLDSYYEGGGRFLDTANKYATWIDGFEKPTSEETIGRWLKAAKKRDDLIISTKSGFPYLDIPRGLTKQLIITEAEKSLKRLGIDTIDLYYAHADDVNTPQEEYMAAYESLIQSGKVRAIGASNFLAWRLSRANMIATQSGGTEFCCVQNRFSYLWPRRGANFGNQIPATEELLDYCKNDKVTLLAYSPLLKGCFGRTDRPIPEEYLTPDNQKRATILSEIAKRYGVSGNVMVTAWMCAEGIIPVISGSNSQQMSENLTACSVTLSKEDHDNMNFWFYGEAGKPIDLNLL
jgi:aryl-alcohol dehydrogenase-like predicted oxidoreductase